MRRVSGLGTRPVIALPSHFVSSLSSHSPSQFNSWFLRRTLLEREGGRTDHHRPTVPFFFHSPCACRFIRGSGASALGCFLVYTYSPIRSSQILFCCLCLCASPPSSPWDPPSLLFSSALLWRSLAASSSRRVVRHFCTFFLTILTKTTENPDTSQ